MEGNCNILIKNGTLVLPADVAAALPVSGGGDCCGTSAALVCRRADILIRDGVIALIGDISEDSPERKAYEDGLRVFDATGCVVIPALADVHVHFREPGFEYKETIRSGCAAAVAGGYTAVCPMPNLNPAPDSVANLRKELDIISRDSSVQVLPYATITEGRKGRKVVDVGSLKTLCAAFSDDGSGVQDEETMLEAMKEIAVEGAVLAAHCEVDSLLRGGYIHDGRYAAAHGHKGICSESEWGQVARDLALARQTGCAYHVCHISTKESVDLIRKAKAEGVDVTCETGPHYLTLCEDDLQEDGRFKMNPPLRSAADRDALIEGMLDGTVDMISTDHAPHSAEEKSKGLEKSAMGVVGLETAFPVMYTAFVRKGLMSLESLVELMSVNPRRRFRLEDASIRTGVSANIAVFETRTEYEINPENFRSKGRATPFAGAKVFGIHKFSIYKNQILL